MNIITPKEREQLIEQLETLKKKRKGISDRIGTARELGDLKENAEYHAAREDQGLNEAKIRQLEDRLATAEVADTSNIPDDVVFLGVMFKIREVASGEEEVCKMVGERAGDLDEDIREITAGSPMGAALISKKVGERVSVELPRGEKEFEIVEIIK